MFDDRVVPETIHAAFDKAAGYFGIKMIKIPIYPSDYRVDTKAVNRAINKNTVMVIIYCIMFCQIKKTL
jgi:sphinganine-1-phosphate aldolase